ncbi:hypothetical protein EVG20_g2785 [Dentipellis fragilis]|uniref:Uncharacterized protein n=1 Tax=Dentipellis fragilis TaxID=205917 RepID=A0A4Y9Z5S3_9AGAM|nr:hypothetical protein EVG20_g2785 [Dentipellis fragilis]
MSSRHAPSGICVPQSRNTQIVQVEQGSQSQSSDAFSGIGRTPQYWYPPYSYRFHILKAERNAIVEQRKAVEKQFHDGLINIHQLTVLEEHWTALLHAKSKEIQDEEGEGPASREEFTRAGGTLTSRPQRLSSRK